jgi:cytochrome c-type biogenesis protein CcmH/NrfF
MIKARRIAAVLAVALAMSFAVALHPLRAQQSDRAKQIGGKFMCMCSCNQVLTQCNHVGCTVSASMLKELDQAVARGDSETTITQAFVQEFGTKVYAEPPRSGFSLVAWMLPSIYLVLGTALVVFVIWRWHSRGVPQASTARSASPFSAEDLERARRRVAQETED